MAYVVPNEAIMQATVEGRHENQQVLSVFTFKLNASGGLADGQAALNAFWIFFGGAGNILEKYASCLSVKCTGLKTRLQWIHPTRFAFLTKVSGTITDGTVAGAAMPVNSAVAITKRGQNANRANIGTLHMPAVPASFVVDGALTGGAVTAYTALGDQLLQEITTATPAATYIPVMFHRTSPSVGARIVAHEVSRFARVQRRRTVGLGS